jgi:hypothetical protein
MLHEDFAKMRPSMSPTFEGWEVHSVVGLVGAVADLGLAEGRGVRTVHATLRQSFLKTGKDDIFHHLVFEDDEAERVRVLNDQTGDKILVGLERLSPKAYIAGTGESLRVVPYIESLAHSSVVLERGGKVAEDLGLQFHLPFSERGYPKHLVRGRRRAKAKDGGAGPGQGGPGKGGGR